jgi:hypothetical protein
MNKFFRLSRVTSCNMPVVSRDAVAADDRGDNSFANDDTCAHTYTYIYTYIDTYMHTYTYTYKHIYIHLYIYSYVHTSILHTYKRTYIHSFIHAINLPNGHICTPCKRAATDAKRTHEIYAPPHVHAQSMHAHSPAKIWCMCV